MSEKLKLVQKFLKMKEKVEEIRRSAEEPDVIRRLSDEILEEL